MFCPNCGTQNENEARNCSQCGTLLVNEQEALEVEAAESAPAEEVAAPVATEELSEPVTFAEEYIPEKEGGKAKKIIIGAVALAAVILVAFFAIKFIGGLFGDDDQKDYSKYPIIYAKDGEVMVRPDGKKESYEIGDTSGESYIQIVDDGKVMFYADSDDYEFDLYYRKVKNMNSDKAVKIAKDVSYFTAREDGKGVLYLKDNKLYYSNLKDDRLIDKNVGAFIISEDGKKFLYEAEDNELYVCGFGKNDKPEKVDSDVEDLYSGYEYKEIYYTKDGKLYYKKDGKNKEKVMSDVVNGAMIDGKLYVLKSEEKKLTFDDLFIDDLSNNPDLIDPDSIVEPERRDYASYDDYWDAWDAYYDEYYEAYELWYMYEEMDTLKEELEDDPVIMNTYTLYAVDGKKTTKLDEGLTSSYINISEDYGFYTKAEQAKIEKIKMSEVSSIYSARYEAESKLGGESSEGTVCVITPSGKTFAAIEKDGEYVSDFTVSENGKYLYCIKSEEAYGNGDVVRYNLGSSKLSKEKTILEDVSYYYYYEDDLVVAKNDDGELIGFVNDKEMDISDEETASLQYFDGALYFIDDYSNGSGELVRFKNGKKKTITDDVYQYYIYGKNKIACIKDYESGDGGELYRCKQNGKCTLIDDEVSRIIFVY